MKLNRIKYLKNDDRRLDEIKPKEKHKKVCLKWIKPNICYVERKKTNRIEYKAKLCVKEREKERKNKA